MFTVIISPVHVYLAENSWQNNRENGDDSTAMLQNWSKNDFKSANFQSKSKPPEKPKSVITKAKGRMLAERLGSQSQLLENVKEEVILSSKVGENDRCHLES